MEKILVGVIHQSECNIQYLSELEFIDLNYEESLQEAKQRFKEDMDSCRNFQDIKDCLSNILEDLPLDDFMECSDFLIGDWKKDGEKWIPDKEGREGFSAIWYDDGHIQVIWSNTVKECSLCSPCFPDQGNLSDTPNGIIAYSLPFEFYEKED